MSKKGLFFGAWPIFKTARQDFKSVSYIWSGSRLPIDRISSHSNARNAFNAVCNSRARGASPFFPIVCETDTCFLSFKNWLVLRSLINLANANHRISRTRPGSYSYLIQFTPYQHQQGLECLLQQSWLWCISLFWYLPLFRIMFFKFEKVGRLARPDQSSKGSKPQDFKSASYIYI